MQPYLDQSIMQPVGVKVTIRGGGELLLETVTLHRDVAKIVPTLPQPVQDLVRLLLHELERHGPVRGNWPNYGKLSRTRHHCHLKKGRPTYVAVWDVQRQQAASH